MLLEDGGILLKLEKDSLEILNHFWASLFFVLLICWIWRCSNAKKPMSEIKKMQTQEPSISKKKAICQEGWGREMGGWVGVL